MGWLAEERRSIRPAHVAIFVAPLESVVHFANAIRVYGDPSSLLQILQQRLPNELFMLLLKELNIQV